MKRSTILATTVILLGACSTKEIDFQTPVQDDVVFYASFEQLSEGEDTRVFVDQNFKLLWDEGDKVSIFNLKDANDEYRFTGKTGDNGGFFELVKDFSEVGVSIDHRYAVYPYSQSTSIDRQGVLSVSLPIEQHYREHSFGPGANLMAAATDSKEFQFKNVCGYLLLKLYGEGVSVSSITLKGNNGEKLAGQASVTMPIDGIPTVEMTNDATSEITLVCETPIQLGKSAEESTQFWFVVHPMTFNTGFTITVNETTGGVFKQSTSKCIVIERNKLSKMSPIEIELIEPTAIPIEDPVFKAYLVANFDIDDDGEISSQEALLITSISVSTVDINSVQGIEYMPNLDSLSCYGNGFGTGSPSDGQLTSLDVSHNTNLILLDCFANQIKELDVTNNQKLSYLYCEGNQLTELDVASNYYLKELACDSNPLSALDLSNNPALDKLYCSNNILTTLGLSNNPALRLLDCTGNKLSQIDVSDKSGLRVLRCSRNELSSLDVSQNKELTSLLCHSNPLSSLDLSNNTKLVTLYCGGTPMSSIDLSNNKNLNYLNIDGSAFESIDLSNNSLLEYLYCIDSNLSTLDVGKNTKLKSLYCEWNQLTSLDLSNNTDLEGLDVVGNKLTSLDVSHNTSLRSLQCRYNLLTTLDVSKNLKLSYLICSPMFDFYNVGPNMLSYLYISPGQEIPNVTVNRNDNNIPDGTCIIIVFDNIASIPEAVDLGLSVKWASFNLGASKPEEYGDYYAWGETEPYYSSLYPLTWKEGKEAGYTWSSYKWCMGNKQSLTKYCTDLDFGYNSFRDNKNVLDPEDDAANVKLGGSWRMPTDVEWTELRENCTWTWTTQNGVKGYQVTARNGISIFFPAAGELYDTYLSEANSFGYYWYSSIYTTQPYYAWTVSFASDGVSWGFASRFCGFSVRPVYAE